MSPSARSTGTSSEPGGSRVAADHYDAVIAGARCAGASTGMLLARAGLRVLLVDPLPRGTDTLSTHALMRGAVLQLHRWGLLDAVRARGTPPIATTTFHYGDEAIRISIKPEDGVEALYAPRRTVLDSILVDAASAAGAEVAHGLSVSALTRDGSGRVRGVELTNTERDVTEVSSDLVIGADGVRSKVARLLGAEVSTRTPHTAASVYGYWKGLPNDGNHWYYDTGVSIGTIPTNEGATCVFAAVSSADFHANRSKGLEVVHRGALERVDPELASRVDRGERTGKLRAFAGIPGFLRRSTGPGWALVGDAGYFKDPITAHGITDALRDAELLSRAVVRGGAETLAEYEATRDRISRGLLDTTDRIASFAWDLEEVKDLHLRLSREMKTEVERILEFDSEPQP